MIDQNRNTVILPIDRIWKSKDLVEHVKRHKTQKELDADIKAYLKGEYEE